MSGRLLPSCRVLTLRSMKFIRTIALAVAVSLLMWPMLSSSASPRQRGWIHLDLLGIGLAWIDVPPGVAILKGGAFEQLEYDVRRVKKNARIILIVEQPEFDLSVLGPHPMPYCVNGVPGVSSIRDGVRRVALQLPPEAHEYKFYFEFRADDQTANTVMKSFQSAGAPRCV